LTLLVVASLVFTGCNQSGGKAEKASEKSSFKWHDPRPAEVSQDGSDDFFQNPAANPESLNQVETNGFLSPTQSVTEEGTANESVFAEAQKALGESSRSGPDGGNLACAWMVNKILKRAVGYKVNGDSTTSMNQVFQSHIRSGKALLVPINDAKPGDVIISPTTWSPKRNTGHVGIIGEGGDVFSNSSGAAKWDKNYTVDRWLNRYQNQKGLQTYVYRILV
jgi:hypothetical protein